MAKRLWLKTNPAFDLVFAGNFGLSAALRSALYFVQREASPFCFMRQIK